MCFSLAVALGNWTAEIPWVGVLTVSLIAMAAVLVCNALAVGPPGAYMFVLACAAGIGVAAEHLPSWHIGLLVAAGGAFAWIVHMSGALINFRGPEKSAVAAAAEGVARFLDAIGSPDEDSARRKAAACVASIVERAGDVPARQPETEQHAEAATRQQPRAASPVRAGDERGRGPQTATRRCCQRVPAGSSFWPVGRSPSTGRPTVTKCHWAAQALGTAPRRTHPRIAHSVRRRPCRDRGRARGIRRFGAGHRACLLGDVRRRVGPAPGV